MWGTGKYQQGYTGRSYNVTGGHEAEAEEAEREKKPNRFGLFVLRLLGGTSKPQPPGHHPPHPH